MSMQEVIPIVVIGGPTASGKTALAECVCTKFSGVMLNGDARQIYLGLSAITAAPSELGASQLFNFKNVSEEYSFAQYITDADAAIARARAEGKLPVIVGGSGLYLDALTERYVPPPVPVPAVRKYVQSLTPMAARAELVRIDPRGAAAVDLQNPRRVARALEVFFQTGKSIVDFWKTVESPYRVLKIGWCPATPEELRARIAVRAGAMMSVGAREVRALLAEGHTLEEPGMQTIGVPQIASYLAGAHSEAETREEIITATWQYARRQMTWFKRSPGIVWYTSEDDVCRSLQNFLHNDSKVF